MKRINFLVGPNGCGKSTYLFNKAVEQSKNELCLAIINSPFSKFKKNKEKNIMSMPITENTLNNLLFNNLFYLKDEKNYQQIQNLLGLLGLDSKSNLFYLDYNVNWDNLDVIEELKRKFNFFQNNFDFNGIKYAIENIEFSKKELSILRKMLSFYQKKNKNSVLIADFVYNLDSYYQALRKSDHKDINQVTINIPQREYMKYNIDVNNNNLFNKTTMDILIHLGILRKKQCNFYRNGNRLSLEELSSGEKTLLAIHFFITKIINEGRPVSYIFIDEPENSLHPQWQQKYIYMLNNSLGYHNIQIYLATHSPTLVLGTLSEYKDDTIVYKVNYSDLKEVYFEDNNNIEEILYSTFNSITPNNHYLSERISYLLHQLFDKKMGKSQVETELSNMKEYSYSQRQKNLLDTIINKLDNFEIEEHQNA